MTQCDLSKVSSGAARGRAELMAAIEGLIAEVAHLALCVKRAVAIADAVKGELPEQLIGDGASRPATETVNQREIEANAASSACNVQTVEMAQASNFPLSPQQDRYIDNAGTSVTGLTGELTAKLEAAFPQPQDANCLEENAIAARVAELHDRLGGFLKSSHKSA